MDNILSGLDDDEVLTKVAQRAACFHRAAKMEVDGINRQFTAFVEEQMKRPKIAALLADAELNGVQSEVRERLAGLLQERFQRVQVPEDDAAVQAFRDKGHRVMPAKFKSQKWSPDTCDCQLHTITDASDPLRPTRTFQSRSCEFHAALTQAERHDAVHRENRLKNDFINTIIEAIPAADKCTWSFDAARILVVDASMLTAAQITEIRTIAGRPKFTGKVTVLG